MKSRLWSKACIFSMSAAEITDGGLAQLVECALCKREAPGSKPGFSTDRSYSVMVITLDFESSDPGSNPGRTSIFFCQLSGYRRDFTGQKRMENPGFDPGASRLQSAHSTD